MPSCMVQPGPRASLGFGQDCHLRAGSCYHHPHQPSNALVPHYTLSYVIDRNKLYWGSINISKAIQSNLCWDV